MPCSDERHSWMNTDGSPLEFHFFSPKKLTKNSLSIDHEIGNLLSCIFLRPPLDFSWDLWKRVKGFKRMTGQEKAHTSVYQRDRMGPEEAFLGPSVLSFGLNEKSSGLSGIQPVTTKALFNNEGDVYTPRLLLMLCHYQSVSQKDLVCAGMSMHGLHSVVFLLGFTQVLCCLSCFCMHVCVISYLLISMHHMTCLTRLPLSCIYLESMLKILINIS